MVFKKFKYSAMIVIAILIIAVVVGVFSKKPNMGLDFTASYLIKVDIKEEFDSAELLGAVQSMQNELGDIRVTSANSGSVEQAYIRVQNIDEETTARLMEKIGTVYEKAVYRSTSTLYASADAKNFIKYVFMFFGTILVAAFYMAVRRGIHAGISSAVSAVAAVLTAVAFLIIFRIPIGISNFIIAAGMAFIFSFVCTVTLYTPLLEKNQNPADLLKDTAAVDTCVVSAVKKSLSIAAAFGVFSVAAIIIRGSVARLFITPLLLGTACGLLYPIFIGMPLMVLVAQDMKSKTKAGHRVRSIK